MRTVVIVGGGNMGLAIARGLVAGGDGAAIVIAEPDEGRRRAIASERWSEGGRVRTEASAAEAIGRGVGSGAADQVMLVLAVKPQMFAMVAEELRAAGLGAAGRGVLVVSIMAGVTTRSLVERLGGGGGDASPRIVRAMPNLPLAYGCGATAVCAGPRATREDVAAALSLFSTLGNEAIELDEPLMDAFTAVAGSGPAYVFALAEAMERGARAVGFDAQQAAWMVSQTVAGAATMLLQHAAAFAAAGREMPEVAATAAELRARVTSKGGTTEAALGVLAERGWMEAVAAAVERARDRGRELGRG